MKKFYYLLSLAAFAPVMVFAQEAPQFEYINSLVTSVDTIISALLPIVVTIAVLFFFWGLALFILNSGDEEARARGRNIMIWGIIALFVIVAVWGLVGLLASIFQVETGGSAAVPGVNGVDTSPVLESGSGS